MIRARCWRVSGCCGPRPVRVLTPIMLKGCTGAGCCRDIPELCALRRCPTVMPHCLGKQRACFCQRRNRHRRLGFQTKLIQPWPVRPPTGGDPCDRELSPRGSYQRWNETRLGMSALPMAPKLHQRRTTRKGRDLACGNYSQRRPRRARR